MNKPLLPAVVEHGEIYWLDWNPARGSEQAGRRPALVVQTDVANRKANYPLTWSAPDVSVQSES